MIGKVWWDVTMVLYVVHGNTYYEGYGHVENIFGIYTDKDMAEAAKDLKIKELFDFEKTVNNDWTYVDDISDIEVYIKEAEANKIIDLELGGYCE